MGYDSNTIAGLFAARSDDARPGLVAPGVTMSWEEVVAAAAERAAWLISVRRPGPFHVAILLDNVPEYLFWLGGAALAGAVVVGANPTHRGEDLARDLAHTECQLLITDAAHLPLVDSLVIGDTIGVVSRTNNRVVLVDDPADVARVRAFSGAALPDPDETAITADSLGYLIFTSGTSGAPKACLCSHGRMMFIGLVISQMFELIPDDVCYLAMPLFHSNALMAGFTPALTAGATMALPSTGKFSASCFLPDVRKFGVTYFNYVGKPLAYILATPEQPDDSDNTLRQVFGNEAAEADVAKFAERFGCAAVDGYGSTEGGAVVQRTPDTPKGSLGRAPEGTMVIDPESGDECPAACFDDQGRLLNAEEATGELVSTGGSSGFEGYWRNDEAEQARLRNGWYWTGDLAYRDQDGFFYFAGRSDDWLRVDGENFAAAPVARILERHPDVVLASVYAVPDTVVGDQVMAALQLQPGAVFEPEKFAAFLAEQSDMGTKWTPRYIRLCEALPITATSKVLTRALRTERWNTPDPVWWQPPSRETAAEYRVVNETDVVELETAIASRA